MAKRGLAAWGWLAIAAGAAGAVRGAADLPSIEALMETEVTTVTGLDATRFASPAAVSVITPDDIRRNGYASVAEALRMVPGMYVGRINAGSYVIGARGLSGSTLTATRFLVLLDGRVVYDPLFSSTFWDVVDTPLEDLDRIEVIRGPGATLWGANAMNGVISIWTKPAAQTQGAAASVRLGSAERAAWLRFGGAAGASAHYRLWAAGDDHDAFELADGGSAHDDFARLRTGFRVDGGARDVTWTLLGDAYSFPRASASVLLPVPGRHLAFERRLEDDTVDGHSLAYSVGRSSAPDDGWRLSAVLDWTNRQTSRLGARRDTVDLDYRAWTTIASRQQVVYGLEAIRTSDRLRNGPSFLFAPERRAWNWFNAFVQDTVELRPGALFFMAGTKVTYHDFVGLAFQPSVRLWLTPSARQMLWVAVSRPVRVPSRLERDGMVVLSYVDPGVLAGGAPTGATVPVGVRGSDGLDAESLLSYEAGHRVELGARWAVETSVFYNRYRDLISVPPAIAGSFNDAGSARTYGAEVAASVKPRPALQVDASLSYLDVRVDGPVFQYDEGASPTWMAQLHAHLDLARHLELHGALSHVGRVERAGIPAYERLDLGAVWQLGGRARLALWGRGLLAPQRREASAVEVPRALSLELGWNF